MTMQQARRRSPIVQCVQLTWENRKAVVELLGEFIGEKDPLRGDGPEPARIQITIPTLTGPMIARTNEWVTKDEHGAFALYWDRVFRLVYEIIEEKPCP